MKKTVEIIRGAALAAAVLCSTGAAQAGEVYTSVGFPGLMLGLRTPPQ